MYQVFNMGNRLEIYCSESNAKKIMEICRKFAIESKIIGFCEKSSRSKKNVVEIKSEFGSFEYS
ncbi:MAG: hypothetical protein ACTSPN_12160 [Promethearchaeota archaeon]